MTLDRRSLLALALASSRAMSVSGRVPDSPASVQGANTHSAASAAKATTGARTAAATEAAFLPLWPQGLPEAVPAGLAEAIVERAAPGAALRDRIARHVTRPGISLLPAPRADGSAVLIIPGGAYQHVVIDKEGLEIAAWLAERGTTAAVLRYRLPGDGWVSGPDAPLQDAQRAVRWLRVTAAARHLDPARIGVIGCSAGGHLAARLLTEFANPVYAARDTVDAADTRPDFGALLYPVIAMGSDYAHATSRTQLLGENPDAARIARYTPNLHVDRDTPPTWLVHAGDDTAVPLQNTLDFHAALRAHSVPTELHVYESGGHGFGLRFTVGKPVAAWPFALRAWAVQHRFMSAIA